MKKTEKHKDAANRSPQPNTAPGFTSGGALAANVLDKMEKIYSAKEPQPGLDLLPGCLAPGTITVICALPREPKSAYLMNLALEAQDKDLNPAVFLPEYSAEEFGLMAISARAGVPAAAARRGRLAREQWPALTRSAGALCDKGLFLARCASPQACDIASDTQNLQEKLKQSGQSLGVVIVDSLNYIKPYDWGNVTMMELRMMAKKLRLPVICSFSLNETPAMQEGFLKLGDTRLAGLCETEADQVFYLRSPACYGDNNYAPHDKLELRCLYPSLGPEVRVSGLEFDHGTLLFKKEAPPPLPTEQDMF